MSLANNNPGNLKAGSHVFQGETGTDSQGFAQFDSIEDGFRAMAHNLSYYFKKGRNTVTKIITNWSADNQQPYINFVASNLQVDPNQALTPNHDNFYNLMLAMSTFELGPEAEQLQDSDIENGLNDAEQDKPTLYSVAPSGGQTNVPAQTRKQTLTASTPTAQAMPKVADVMKTAGFGQGAIDWFTSSGFGWVEVGVAAAVALLLFRNISLD